MSLVADIVAGAVAAVAATLGSARALSVAALSLSVAGAFLVALDPSLLGWVRGVA
jgi:hypothetical protein